MNVNENEYSFAAEPSVWTGGSRHTGLAAPPQRNIRNGAMEAINGWIKAELLTDFHINENETIQEDIANYIHFFNEERPAYSLNYLTPKQFKEQYSTV